MLGLSDFLNGLLLWLFSVRDRFLTGGNGGNVDEESDMSGNIVVALSFKIAEKRLSLILI